MIPLTILIALIVGGLAGSLTAVLIRRQVTTVARVQAECDRAAANLKAERERREAAEKALAARTPPPLVGRRVTIHTVQPDDQTITGWCIGDYPDRIMLDNAAYVTKSGEVPIANSRQWFYTSHIAWIDDHDDTVREG